MFVKYLNLNNEGKMKAIMNFLRGQQNITTVSVGNDLHVPLDKDMFEDPSNMPTLTRLFFKDKILWFMFSISPPINMNQIVNHIYVHTLDDRMQARFYSSEPSFSHEYASIVLDEATLIEYLEPSVPWPRLKKLTISLRLLGKLSDSLASRLNSVEILTIENLERDELEPVLKKLHCPSIRTVKLGVVSYADSKLLFKSFPNVSSLDLSYRAPNGLELLMYYNCVTRSFIRIQTFISSNSSIVDVWFEHLSYNSLAIRSRRHECMWFHLLMMNNFINKVIDGVVSLGSDPLFHLFDITFKPSDDKKVHKFLDYVHSSHRVHVDIDYLYKLALPSIVFKTVYLRLNCQTGDLNSFICWAATYFPSLRALKISCQTNTGVDVHPLYSFKSLLSFQATHLSYNCILNVLMSAPALESVITDLDDKHTRLLESGFKDITFTKA